MARTDITFDQLETLTGHELGKSDWFEIDQARVNQFADATGDHQWIHVDVARATRELGSPIVHGYLTLSLLPFLAKDILHVSGVSRGINYGSDKVRFMSPVPVGARVRLSQRLIEVVPKAGGKQLRVENVMEIEDQERPAMVAEALSLLYAAE